MSVRSHWDPVCLTSVDSVASQRAACAGLQAIERQAAAGVAEADCIVLVVDGQSGVTGADEEIVTWLRRTHPTKPVRPLLEGILRRVA